eukprot:scaffold98550_cov58-Phaeocystis_antarctica.AAC.1
MRPMRASTGAAIANCPTCRTEIREIRDLSTAAVLHKFAMVDNQPPTVACSDAFVARGEVRPASRDAGKGDAAAASGDGRAGDEGGSAAADDCNANANGSFAATVAVEDGDGADADDGGGATSRTTATDEPGAAGGSRLDVEQTIGLLLELNVNSARKSKAAAKVAAPTVTTDVIAAAVAA